MKPLVIAILVAVAIVGPGAAYLTYQNVQAQRAIVRMASAPRPLNDMPVVLKQEYRCRCGSVDGGIAADCAVPFDGGTAGIDIQASTWYVAPITGATSNVRVGTTSVTSKKGMEIGPSSAIAGTNAVLEVYPPWGCASEGAVQDIDVLAGQRP